MFSSYMFICRSLFNVVTLFYISLSYSITQHLFCVFFNCSGDHRNLHLLTHSFPPRRSSDPAVVREPGQHYRGIPHGVLPCPPPCNSCWTRSRSRSSPSSARCCCSKPCSPHASCRACASGGWPASPLSGCSSS